MKVTEYLNRLSACLAELPGVGRRTAERMALKLARDPKGLLRELDEALRLVAENVQCCTKCGSVTTATENPCRLCTDASRDGSVLCVVEDPHDILTIEKSGGFRGRYHALMGKLSPMNNMGPRDIRMDALVRRLDSEGFQEIVLALNTDVESDATASYIREILRDRKVKLSRIAFGLPAGSGIMYSDAVTLTRAMKGRQPM